MKSICFSAPLNPNTYAVYLKNVKKKKIKIKELLQLFSFFFFTFISYIIKLFIVLISDLLIKIKTYGWQLITYCQIESKHKSKILQPTHL